MQSTAKYQHFTSCLELDSTNRFISSASPLLSRFISSFTCQPILVIISTLIIHHSFTLSLQAQNLPFQQILSNFEDFWHSLESRAWTAFMDHWTGPDLPYSSQYFQFIFPLNISLVWYTKLATCQFVTLYVNFVDGPTGFLCGWFVGLEFPVGQLVESDYWREQFQTISEDVSVCNVLMHSAHQRFHVDALYKSTFAYFYSHISQECLTSSAIAELAECFCVTVTVTRTFLMRRLQQTDGALHSP